MSLEEMIAGNTNVRELKRALSVQMRIIGMKHKEIRAVLGVSSSYISKWESRYSCLGVKGLKSVYKGSKGYLTLSERESIKKWIGEKSQITLLEVMEHIEKEYNVVYSSLESYYSLLKEGGMSWHQGKKKVALVTSGMVL